MRESGWKQQNESQEMGIRMFPGTPVSIPLYVLLDLRLLSVYEKRQASRKKFNSSFGKNKSTLLDC